MCKYLLISILICCGCYRMPEDGEVSVLPITNNPTITGHSGGGIPGVDM